MHYLWKNGAKYYRVAVQQDLFGLPNIICNWGRTGSKLGGYKIIICNNQTDLDLQIDKIKKRRKYHGYFLQMTKNNDGI